MLGSRPAWQPTRQLQRTFALRARSAVFTSQWDASIYMSVREVTAHVSCGRFESASGQGRAGPARQCFAAGCAAGVKHRPVACTPASRPLHDSEFAISWRAASFTMCHASHVWPAKKGHSVRACVPCHSPLSQVVWHPQESCIGDSKAHVQAVLYAGDVHLLCNARCKQRDERHGLCFPAEYEWTLHTRCQRQPACRQCMATSGALWRSSFLGGQGSSVHSGGGTRCSMFLVAKVVQLMCACA